MRYACKIGRRVIIVWPNGIVDDSLEPLLI